METPKFTKGPWETDALIVYQDEGIQGHICSMSPFFNDRTKEANAKLIAASPSLYEACEAAVSYLGDRSTFKEGEEILYSILQAALKKATD